MLCDLEGDFEALERAFYLGMTRANFGVFVACDEGTSAWFNTQRLGLQSPIGK